MQLVCEQKPNMQMWCIIQEKGVRALERSERSIESSRLVLDLPSFPKDG